MSSSVELCRRKSCTRLDLEWSCGLSHAMEINTVTVEDLDEYIEPDTKPEASSDVWGASITSEADTVASSEFDDAPFAVHSPEIRSMWTEPDSSDVHVRGKTYMEDQLKVPAGKTIGKLLHVDLWKFETAEERHHIAMKEETRPHSVLVYCREKFPDSRVFIVNIEMPNADNLSIVIYWLLPPAPNSQ
ncbi:hypothetical protein PHMEG_00010697, partial [Phytophthora megakarya]